MKIHFLSDSTKTNSGFSIVTRHLATGLKKLGHDVTMTGIQTSYAPECTHGILQYPLATDVPENMQFVANLRNVNPDLVIYIGDFYTDVSYLSKIPLDMSIPVIVYCPVEGAKIPKRMVNDLNEIASKGKVVAQCQYGLKEMQKCGINTSRYVYHGFDPEVFHPGIYDHPDDKISFVRYINDKWTEIPDLPITELKNQFNHKFTYLFVGVNMATRKRIERLFKAYSLLIHTSKQLQDTTHLHLHTVPVNYAGINLLDIANDMNIRSNISFSYAGARGTLLSDSAMNIIFNSADVFVSASGSEGFSLPHLEAMACGKPCISPDCTSMTELIGNDENMTINRGLLAGISDDYMLQDGSIRFLVDTFDLSTKMYKIYKDDDIRKRLGLNAENWSRQYTWDKIIPKWNEIIK